MPGVRDPLIVKLGGSHAFATHLKDWLGAIAEGAGRVVIVPGGGPFADAVRAAQPQIGFDDRAAHHMSLLAMEQYGCALMSIGTGLAPASSIAAIRRVLRQRLLPVWSPIPMVLRAGEVPRAWDMTSDSLAAWLAGRIGAKHLVLVKHIETSSPAVSARHLAARGIVDPLFPRFLAASGAQASVAGPADHRLAAAAFRVGQPVGARIEGH
jgi:5-(aminomethyl)-3-furanmethanol phosphate kinase